VIRDVQEAVDEIRTSEVASERTELLVGREGSRGGGGSGGASGHCCRVWCLRIEVWGEVGSGAALQSGYEGVDEAIFCGSISSIVHDCKSLARCFLHKPQHPAQHELSLHF
jgi:hypothetical protein